MYFEFFAVFRHIKTPLKFRFLTLTLGVQDRIWYPEEVIFDSLEKGNFIGMNLIG